MTCSTNTYFHSLEQSLKEYIDYELIKNILHVSLIFIYFTKTNYQIKDYTSTKLLQTHLDLISLWFTSTKLTIEK